MASSCMLKACSPEVDKEKGEKGLTGTTPHAWCRHAERGDVAEAPMEILTQTFNVWKRACVYFPTLKLKEIFPVCHVSRWLLYGYNFF